MRIRKFKRNRFLTRMAGAGFFLLLLTPLHAAEPLTLKEALNRAVNNNPVVEESRLGEKAAQAGVTSASGKHWPKLTLDANYTQRQDAIPFIPAQSATIPPHFSDDYASWGLLLSLPLYQGGQTQAGVALAKVRKDFATLALSQSRNELIANTVNTYHKLLQLQQLRKAAQGTLTALLEQRKNVQLLLDVGRLPRVDLLKIEVQLANEEQRLFALEEGISTSGATLQTLMGDPVNAAAGEFLLADSMRMPETGIIPEKAATTPWQERPEYRAARAGVQEAEHSRRIALGKLLPSVNTFAGYTDQYGFSPAYDEANWSLGVQATIPLFERSLYADLARENLLREKAQVHQRVIDQQLRLENENARAALRESARRIETANRAILSAQESFRIEQEKSLLGAGTMSELLLAQAADMTAAANLSQALFDYNAALVAWRKATGSLEEYLK
jgi:outer membrane protein TolC